MGIDSIIAANGIIEHAEDKGSKVTPMKLQKLAYLVHGLLLTSRPDAGIAGGFEAWPYGPVNRDIYFAFRKYGGQPIAEPVEEVFDRAVPSLNLSEGGPTVKAAIQEVWDAFGEWSAIQLSEFTHQEGSPWHESVAAFKASRNREPEPFDRVEIPDEKIGKYFAEELLVKP